LTPAQFLAGSRAWVLGNVDVVTAGVESIGGGPMGKDATSA
jgi:hypothetical protein